MNFNNPVQQTTRTPAAVHRTGARIIFHSANCCRSPHGTHDAILAGLMAKDVRVRFQVAGKPPRQIVRPLLQQVEVVGKDEARVKGSRGQLLKAIASVTGNRAIVTAGAGGLNLDWAGRDSMEDAYVFCVPL